MNKPFCLVNKLVFQGCSQVAVDCSSWSLVMLDLKVNLVSKWVMMASIGLQLASTVGKLGCTLDCLASSVVKLVSKRD